MGTGCAALSTIHTVLEAGLLFDHGIVIDMGSGGILMPVVVGRASRVNPKRWRYRGRNQGNAQQDD